MALPPSLRQRVRRLGWSAHISGDSKSDRNGTVATPLRSYSFKGGLVWKGGVNPSVSKITQRPPPPEPLGTTGGVRQNAASERPTESETSADNSNSSD